MSSKGLVKALDPKEANDAIDEILLLAQQNGVRVAVAGGLAMQVYGSDRFTKDVDFVALDVLPLANMRVLSIGGVGGFASNGVPVDIIVREDEAAALYDAACENANDADGVPVVAPEYLAAMKLVAHRQKDLADLDFLITSGQLDFNVMRALLRKYLGWYTVQEFDRIAEQALWLASKERK